MYFHVNKITSFESKLMITIDMVNRLTKKREKLHPLTHTSVHIKMKHKTPQQTSKTKQTMRIIIHTPPLNFL